MGRWMECLIVEKSLYAGLVSGAETNAGLYGIFICISRLHGILYKYASSTRLQTAVMKGDSYGGNVMSANRFGASLSRINVTFRVHFPRRRYLTNPIIHVVKCL